MLTNMKLIAVNISYFFLNDSDLMYKNDNSAGINPRKIDVSSFLKLVTSKYSFVLLAILFQCVFSTISVLVAGSFNDIFRTKIKNMSLVKTNGISRSIGTEF